MPRFPDFALSPVEYPRKTVLNQLVDTMTNLGQGLAQKIGKTRAHFDTAATTLPDNDRSVGDILRDNTSPAPRVTAARHHRSMYTLPRAEQLTARRLGNDPRFANRIFFAPPPPDPGYDWFDDLGHHYDAMGDGSRAERFRPEQFNRSVLRHVLKADQYTVIDMTGYTPAQISQVRAYVDTFPAEQQQWIVRIGF